MAAIRDQVDSWTTEQQVGRLVVAGVPVDGADQTAAGLVHERFVRGVFLHGRSDADIAGVRALVDAQQAAVPTGDPAPLIVATDQEGGDVQVLQGPGFSAMPYATEQAAMGADDLRAQSKTWGSELAAAGITLNLAPVADLVPDEATGAANAPIGAYLRNYGYDAEHVAAGAGAFADGMEASGVAATVKHFPGLGRVVGNTDYESDVVDAVTTRADPSVELYRGLIRPGRAVMVSLARYDLIDPAVPAVFSKEIVTGMLRGDLGFDGVVITDDVSSAQAVAAWAPGDRAVAAVEAGCDIVLASADSSVAGEMLDALLARAEADPVFADRVAESAARVQAFSTGA